MEHALFIPLHKVAAAPGDRQEVRVAHPEKDSPDRARTATRDEPQGELVGSHGVKAEVAGDDLRLTMSLSSSGSAGPTPKRWGPPMDVESDGRKFGEADRS